MTHLVRVFISHSWSYSGHYNKLEEWIFGNSWDVDGQPLSFYNYSVPKDNPIHFAQNTEQLQAAIDRKIKAANIVICPTGMYSEYSKWIGKEIASASKFRIPLLAVNPWAQQRKSVVVRQHADEEVGWTKQGVVSAIWRLVS